MTLLTLLDKKLLYFIQGPTSFLRGLHHSLFAIALFGKRRISLI